MPTQLRISFKPLLVAALVSFYLPVFALDDTLARGKQLLDTGQAKAAYQLLEPLESARAGEPDFDFLLGLAALDIGENTRAVFALERVLALDPSNARARAEIARAYLALGENRAAREEFERVRQQDIPQGVASTIDSLLAMIERVESRNKPSFKAYVELGAGSDSNVNSATESTTVAVPALGLATLNPNSVQNGDSFATLAGGVSYRHPLKHGHVFTAGANATLRQNFNDSQFDTDAIDGSLGCQRTRGANTYNAALAASTFLRDGTTLRDTIGVNAQWQHDYGTVRQSTLFLQYAAISYPGQAIRDVDRIVLGAGYAAAIGPRSVAFGSAYLGEEMEKSAINPHLGHTLAGLRAGLQHRFDDQWSVLANAGYENRRYGGIEPLFTAEREDDQIEAGLGVSYQIDKRWRVGGRFAYVNVDSNIPVYKYDREIFTLSLRLEP